MARAWIENGNIFLTEDNTLIINYPVIEVPHGTTLEDLKIVDGKIVLKTREEKDVEYKTKFNAEVEQKRRIRYELEADPIYFKALEMLYRGNQQEYEKLMRDWINKRDEIKQQMPYLE